MGFKVKDSRTFDSDGNVRSDSTSSGASLATDPSGPVADGGEGSDGREIDFPSFVMSLATQALMQLGIMAAPEGMQVPVDRAAAKQTIEILAMLKRKTSGNLEPAELRMLDDILHNLHLSFVKSLKS